MKIKSAKYFIIVTWILLSALSGCKKQDILPTVITYDVTNIQANYAVLGGEVISEGSSAVTAEGVCWSIHQNPTLADLSFYKGTGKGGFSDLVSLSLGTTYYVRAYATNAAGTAYGNQVKISIPALSPTVKTSDVLTMTSTTATGGGYISADGGATITVRGVCWSTSHNPKISDYRTTDGSGAGYFISSVSGLTTNTNYYFRAYATNSEGTGYGEEFPFTINPLAGPPVSDVDGNIYPTITIGTQVWMVRNLSTTRYSNGDPIPNLSDNLEWSNASTGAYCDYNNDVNNSFYYGRLYNWQAVTDSRKIAPAGWHIPNSAEWKTLTDYLINNGYGYHGIANNIAKSLAAKSGWQPSYFQGDAVGNDLSGNNASGFTALPGGYRQRKVMGYGPHNTYYWEYGRFYSAGYAGCWWVSIGCIDAIWCNIWGLSSSSSSFPTGTNSDYPQGVSVRCLKN